MKIKTHLVVGGRVERSDDPRLRNSRITTADQQSEPEQAVKVPASLAGRGTRDQSSGITDHSQSTLCRGQSSDHEMNNKIMLEK